MTKQSIRQDTLNALDQMPQALRQVYEDNLLHQLLNKIQRESIKTIGFYYGFHPEIMTPHFFDTLWQEGVQIYLPRMQPKRQLTFHLYQDQDPLDVAFKDRVYQPYNEAKSIDPSQLDLLIVPGVAFKLDGHRIGHGGGYYDRLLEKSTMPTIALVFPQQVYKADAWNVQAHDCAVESLLIARKENEED
ncbi:5-formyltetrahydrofolate cyclo-ligase [Dolosicoccus paucivorans]|uniref:5-formyltetrahydrofolate cyclo-ligase n=1 Tax=Dolosicoccus paucivorans TaxID=84521 RepID=UPI000888DA76|nr:5-formyltetrahydrofolate cyclo-ligase [Dolosicoccus paucivorans]SDI91840.1 5-formyltetrahydrofolate cyclo-ligase [Dolosicoccus paucivorans]